MAVEQQQGDKTKRQEKAKPQTFVRIRVNEQRVRNVELRLLCAGNLIIGVLVGCGQTRQEDSATE